MDYPSYLRRTIYLPELGMALHFDTSELSPRIASFLNVNPQPQEGSRSALEGLIAEECAPLLGIPSSRFLTYSEWKRQTNLLRSVVASEQYQTEMINTYGGQNTQLANKLRKEIQHHADQLNKLLERYGSLPTFISAFIRNGLLGVAFLTHGRKFNLRLSAGGGEDEEYSGSVFATGSTALLASGMNDVDCVRWSEITGALSYAPLPTAKHCYDNLQPYQLPFTGSFTIKGISLETFRSTCYGAAAVVLGATGWGAAQHFRIGETPSIACVTYGVVTALVFVSVAPLAELSVTILDRLSSKPSSGTSPAGPLSATTPPPATTPAVTPVVSTNPTPSAPPRVEAGPSGSAQSPPARRNKKSRRGK